MNEQEAREFIIGEIIQTEWDMFQMVNNQGGRAECQDDPETFQIMRGSQFACWPMELLLQYMQDLSNAIDEGRNLITEKYARMMEYTDPEYFNANLRDKLPELTMEAQQSIETIVEIQTQWSREMDEKYPNLARRGRPVEEVGEDGTVSRSIYARGELGTMSTATLYMYCDMCRQAQARGENLAIKEREYMVRNYGFKSLEEADAYYATHA